MLPWFDWPHAYRCSGHAVFFLLLWSALRATWLWNKYQSFIDLGDCRALLSVGIEFQMEGAFEEATGRVMKIHTTLA